MHYADIGQSPRFVSLMFNLEGGGGKELQNRRISAPPSVVTLLEQMLREQESREPYFQDMILAQLSMVLTILLRQEGQEKPNALHGEHEILRRTQQYVALHVREKLSVTLVAEQVDVSPSYLTALFHKNLHISPGEYIRRVKLQESKKLIREGNLNFTEIAAVLQYSTVHHFSRQFKEKFGITPSEYARSCK
jgi:AraC-like DNA-binding protein